MKFLGLGNAKKLVGLIILPLALLSGCQQEYALVQGSVKDKPGNPGDPPSGSPTPRPTCTQTVESITQDLRIMFMVDQSGSTFEDNNTSAVGDGTDPNYVYRKLAIDTFIQQYGHKTNFTYSFGYFRSESGGDTAKLYDYNTNNYKKTSQMVSSSIYYGSSAQLSTALNNYLNVAIDTNAGTPYDNAFNANGFEVIQDVSKNPNKYQYVLIFMSDGMPNPDRSDAQLKSLVSNTKAAVDGTSSKFTISGVYFGPANNTGAINKVKLVASEGGGQFVNTNTTPNFNIEDVIKVSVCK